MHALKFWEKCGSRSFLSCPAVGNLAFGLVVTVTEVHAIGSTVRLASRITEMLDKYEVTPIIVTRNSRLPDMLLTAVALTVANL